MKIGWVIPTTRCFGAVREMVEISNCLHDRGHEITIFSTLAEPVVWMPCSADYGFVEDVANRDLDIVIGITDWKPSLDDAVMSSNATLKIFCLMGFDPDGFVNILRGKEKPVLRGHKQIINHLYDGTSLIADSQWQIDFIKEHTGIQIGPSIGGVNLDTFKPDPNRPKNKTLRIIATGDTRPRKGFDTVKAAIDLVKLSGLNFEFETYWGKNLYGNDLADFYRSGDIFVDAHKRGGWCNPVIEAMACGVAVVCTNIGATSSFAIDGVTAMTVNTDEALIMASRILDLAHDETKRNSLIVQALNKAEQLGYGESVAVLDSWFYHRYGILREGSTFSEQPLR